MRVRQRYLQPASWFLLLAGILRAPVALPAPDEPAKLPIPSEAALKEATGRIRVIYKADFERAQKSPKAQADLARKLLQTAEAPAGEPIERYAVLAAARESAVQAGEMQTALKAVELIQETFQVEPWKLRAEVLARLVKTAPGSFGKQAVARTSLELLEQALLADEYPAAKRLSDVSQDAARKGKDPALLKRASAWGIDILQVERAFAESQKALVTLKSEPDQPEAHLAVGRFRAFLKGDWEAGLPFLARGSDARVRSQAEADLRKPTAAAARVKVADDWWDLGDKEGGMVKRRLQARAVHWYRLGAPELTGLEKAKAEARIKEVEEKDAPKVLAVWQHAAGGGAGHLITLYSNGHVDSPDGEATWSLEGRTLILRWPAQNAPGGHWIDRCTLSPDRRAYSGSNQGRVAIRGTLLEGGI